MIVGIHYQPSQVMTRLNHNLSRLFLTVGALLVLVSILGLVVIQPNVSPTQDNRTQAVNPEGQVRIQLSATPSTVVPGQNIAFTGVINTRNIETDGVQLILTLPKSSLTTPPIMSLVAGSNLQVGLSRIEDRGSVFELQLVALPSTIGQPFVTNTDVPFLRIEGVSNNTGSYRLAADQNRSMVTRFGSNPVVDELAPILSIDYSINSNSPLPTNTPTPSPPLIPPTNTPTPLIGNNQNLLSFSYKLQGLNRHNQQFEGVLFLRTNSSQLESHEENGSESNDVVSTEYELPVKFISGRSGVVSPLEHIRLNSIPIAPGGSTYDVLVKTPYSLRKKLGTLTLRPGFNTAPPSWSNIQIQTGDFWQRPRGEWNVFNLRDVTQILNVYTRLQIPITSSNYQYDVNFDQIIDIMDVALILSNYTALEKFGD